jgi:hypothetical protein
LPLDVIVHPRTLSRLGVGFTYLDQTQGQIVVLHPNCHWYTFSHDIALSTTFTFPSLFSPTAFDNLTNTFITHNQGTPIDESTIVNAWDQICRRKSGLFETMLIS